MLAHCPDVFGLRLNWVPSTNLEAPRLASADKLTGMFQYFRNLGIFASVVLGGCASQQGPESLLIPASRYESAFDAATEVARAEGMPAALRDRRSGIIETVAQPAGSLLEPWRNDNASLSQATENTLAYQRRRARFEFVQRNPSSVQTSNESASNEFSVPSSEDLTQAQSDLELRVWVYVERASAPGLRRSTWTRRNTTRTRLIAPEGDTGPTPSTSWTAVARDAAYERRLLAAVENAMASEK